jgi:hypothetical protein
MMNWWLEKQTTISLMKKMLRFLGGTNRVLYFTFLLMIVGWSVLIALAMLQCITDVEKADHRHEM